MTTAPMVDYKIHWLKMMSVPESRAVVGRHDGINGRDNLIRDRDGAYGQSFRSTVTAMGVEEVVTAPRSPWQNPYVERLIGSVRHECLDHSIILNERHLRRILGSYLDYYHGSRTHLSIGKDTPDGRPFQPAGSGTVVSLPKVGGLHHRYERLAA